MQKVNFQGAQSEKGTCDYGDFLSVFIRIYNIQTEG